MTRRHFIVFLPETLKKVKGKDKGQPKTGYEGPEGK